MWLSPQFHNSLFLIIAAFVQFGWIAALMANRALKRSTPGKDILDNPLITRFVGPLGLILGAIAGLMVGINHPAPSEWKDAWFFDVTGGVVTLVCLLLLTLLVRRWFFLKKK